MAAYLAGSCYSMRMETLIAVCGFAGSWLLVAGPLYQAALELHEEKIENSHFFKSRKELPPQPHVSNWWWLLPPIKILLERRQTKLYREAFLHSLPNDQVDFMINFINKATAWTYVSGGGFLLACKETYEMLHVLEWHELLFWPIIIVLGLACLFNTAARISHSERLRRKHD